MSTITKFLAFFALAALAVRPSIAADSLVVSPANPTISDSIKFEIFSFRNCCTVYNYYLTSVALTNDSIITLNFTASLIGYCPCPINFHTGTSNPAILDFERGPLPAREYYVYEECQSCFGQACQSDSFVVTRTEIGTFTVSQSAAVVFHQKSVPLESIGKASGNGRVYDIRGALMSPNRIGRQTPGVYFIKPDEHSAARLKIWY
jgi:hypothetical protein